MSLNKFIFIMIRCLILTILIETSIGYIMGYRKKDLLNILLVNVMTNPLVTSVPVYFNFFYGVMCRNIVLLILEVLTIIIEGIIYKKYLERKKINGICLSLLLNASSYLIGVIIYGF